MVKLFGLELLYIKISLQYLFKDDEVSRPPISYIKWIILFLHRSHTMIEEIDDILRAVGEIMEEDFPNK